MSSRTWVYTQLQADATIATYVGDRVHESTSLQKAPGTKPFIMYRTTSDVSDMKGDDVSLTRNKTFLIFVHDIPGDYIKIDLVIDAIHALFENAVDQANNIIRATWLESSEDFRDEDMGTIMRYCRISVKERI